MREAPTPVYISTKSKPLVNRNGTFASPAINRASNVLPVPGGPTGARLSESARRSTEPPRLAQEIDDLLHFFLRLVDACDVVEVMASTRSRLSRLASSAGIARCDPKQGEAEDAEEEETDGQRSIAVGGLLGRASTRCGRSVWPDPA